MTEDTYLGDITDPLTLNRYNYVKSSPLNYTDPSGHRIPSLTETASEIEKKVHEKSAGAKEFINNKISGALKSMMNASQFNNC